MPTNLKNAVKKIVRQANELKNTHSAEKRARVNYAAIICQTKGEYDRLVKEASKSGNILAEGETGPLFHVPAIATVAGPVKIVKIRKPSRLLPEMGDADFTVADYRAFKKRILLNPRFRLLKHEDYELIELADPSSKVRAYFSNRPMDRELGI